MEGKLAVVILAAGKSTRFKSRTTKLAHTLCGKPMLEWVLDEALPSLRAQVIVVYGEHTADLREQYVQGYDGTQIDFVLQDPPNPSQ